MREIKFRAWDKTDKAISEPFGLNDISYGEIINQKSGMTFTISNCILMQFTGLKDKNGIDIYEGDILQNGFKERFVVLWGNGSWIDSTSPEPGCGVYCDLYRGTGGVEEYKKVVGNIYENPELIK